ncbi:hypothetical protein [Streptomyces sp. ME19-01-6]|uniref:hypothetical protein n=1 Tax=Streptomyces sp. ME19-01-6 TaxID=3028686 RepID=UPI0029BC58A5|nr:hypothetical protein [Streptomyces sp. ME19-01-6]MDX3232980.1 hypothetical protein [Streptomyces sp. ME19-01-6]
MNPPLAECRTTVEYFVQCQQPDGTWEQCSSTAIDLDFATERLAARRRMQPEFEYRIARRTTTVVVEYAADNAGCAECGHPEDQHAEADEPVSVGQCRQCAADPQYEDDSWHDYEPREA